VSAIRHGVIADELVLATTGRLLKTLKPIRAATRRSYGVDFRWLEGS